MKLKNITGFNNLSYIGGYINIYNNNALKIISGFNKLSQIINKSGFTIIFNELLTEVNGFNSLQIINGELIIENNNNLVSVDGFNQLNSVEGNIYITSNPALVSFIGLSNLTLITGGLKIYGNPNLAMIDLINLNNVTGKIVITDTVLFCGNLSDYIQQYTTCTYCQSFDNSSINCTSCYPNYFGISCNESCECENDEVCIDGPTGNGSCFTSCELSNFGNTCNTISNLNLSSTNIAINNKVVYINGATSINSSTISLQSTNLTSLSDFYLQNSVIELDLISLININKCFQLTNSTLIINLNEQVKNTTLIQFDPTCSKITNIKYKFVNQSNSEGNQCPTLNIESNIISITFIPCGNKPSSTWIIILIVVACSVVVLLALFLLLSFTVLKKLIFPNRKKEKRKEVMGNKL